MEDSKSRSPLALVVVVAKRRGADDSVYVGKYRGRKVAISEFREHLSESKSYSKPESVWG